MERYERYGKHETMNGVESTKLMGGMESTKLVTKERQLSGSNILRPVRQYSYNHSDVFLQAYYDDNEQIEPHMFVRAVLYPPTHPPTHSPTPFPRYLLQTHAVEL
jgi:hypothetical protein